MKQCLVQFISLILLLFTASSCGDDLSSMMEPDSVTIVTDIVLQNRSTDSSSTATIPELKVMDLDITKRYNNSSESAMVQSEILSGIVWQLDSKDDVQLVSDTASNNVKLSGTGTANLKAIYRPSNENGYQQISSNTISITVVESALTGIKVQPDLHYSVGCDNSDRPSSELVEGCLMQFQLIGYYDNDTTADLSDNAIWYSENENKAILVTDLPASIDKDWFEIITDFLDTNDLNNKKGLVLGKSTGGFEISAIHGDFSNTTDTVTIVGPELYSMGGRINTYDGNFCYENCQLHENVIINLEAVGTYTNNVSTEITRQTTIQSNVDPVYVAIGTNMNEVTGQPIYTGVVSINYNAPEEVTFTIEADRITASIDCSVFRENLLSVERTQPRGSSHEVASLSNTDNVFSLAGNYNNDQFELFDSDERLKRLNLESFTWHSLNESVAIVDTANLEANWINLKGVKVTTIGADEGSTTSIRASSPFATIDWSLTINNTTSVPISLSISPANGSTFNIEAGADTQFSALAVFNNQTSAILVEGEVEWSSDPDDCTLGSTTQPCISSNGIVTAHENIRIRATTAIDPLSDISTYLDIEITPTILESITVVPLNYSIYERNTLQFSSIGTFSNNRSIALDNDCVDWSLAPSGDAAINNQGILTANNANTSITVTAVTSSCTESWMSIPTPRTGDTNLTIVSLPRISLGSSHYAISEGGSMVTLGFQADATFDGDIIVPYEISGSALAGSDHDLFSGYAVITSGTSREELSFSIDDDTLDEDVETIEIEILENNIINAKGDTTTDIVITINDNDDEPTLSFLTNPAVDESIGSTSVIFQINSVSGRDITIYVGVSGDVDDNDYGIENSSLTIAAGNTEIELVIDITNDSFKEGDEQLILDVSANYADTASLGIPTVAINDDDGLAFSEQPSNINCSTSATCSYTPIVNSTNTLSFSVFNLPGWMDQDPDTGIVWGTAPGSPVTIEEVIICVEDQTDSETTCLMPFSITIIN